MHWFGQKGREEGQDNVSRVGRQQRWSAEHLLLLLMIMMPLSLQLLSRHPASVHLCDKCLHQPRGWAPTTASPCWALLTNPLLVINLPVPAANPSPHTAAAAALASSAQPPLLLLLLWHRQHSHRVSAASVTAATASKASSSAHCCPACPSTSKRCSLSHCHCHCCCRCHPFTAPTLVLLPLLLLSHLVEEAEDVVLVHEVRHRLNHRPGGLLEVAVTQAGEGLLIHHLDLGDVALPEGGNGGGGGW